jgi:hypothetical protein
MSASAADKPGSVGLPRRLRETCGFFFAPLKDRRSPPKSGVALRYELRAGAEFIRRVCEA